MDKKKIPDSLVYTILSSFFAVMAIMVFLADIFSGTSSHGMLVKTGTASLIAFVLVLIKKFFDIGYEHSKGHVSVFTIVTAAVVLAVIGVMCML